MKLTSGVYENLISEQLEAEKKAAEQERLACIEQPVDSAEHPRMIADYISNLIQQKLSDESLNAEERVEIANRIIRQIGDIPQEETLKETDQILAAVVPEEEKVRLEQTSDTLVRPLTGFRVSNLFTGRQSKIPMYEEILRDIASADRIYIIVSFLRLSGIRLLMEALRKFTSVPGHSLKIITTTYCGHTEAKAVQQLSELPNTEIKISYNTSIERLHAKAYIFERESGLSTAYIGSSNLSKSAQTEGLEWNVRVTNVENPQIINAAIKTFEVYWNSKEFEDFKIGGIAKFYNELQLQKEYGEKKTVYYRYSVLPHQKAILDKLKAVREDLGIYRNLVVAATGTGKTVMSGFDYQLFKQQHPNARLLYVAHRQEILEQARNKFRSILGDYNFGELWVGNYAPQDSLDHLFVSVATFNNNVEEFKRLGETFYDYIIIDEAHHMVADSYRPIINFFKPKILLGLTATPERMDGQSLLPDFGGRISAEIRLPQALQEGLLTPFQYLCISDSVDLSTDDLWSGNKYFVEKLSGALRNPERVEMIVSSLSRYLPNEFACKALCYCVDKKHAEFMAEEFVKRGFRAAFLTSNNSNDRGELNRKLAKGEINYLFVVDIFNEGVDIPEVDTLLLLRPTESLTIYLQQLGRGLRLSPGKDVLTVFDYVAQVNKKYDYASRFRALLTKSSANVEKQIKDGFALIPHGCYIMFEKKAHAYVLNNIKNAVYNSRRIEKELAGLTYTPTISQFLESNGQELPIIYRTSCWTSLKKNAGKIDYAEDKYTKRFANIMTNFCHINSLAYIRFIQRCIKNNFKYAPQERIFALMLYYTLYSEIPQKSEFGSVEKALQHFAQYQYFVQELSELMEYLENHIEYETFAIGQNLPGELEQYGCYTKDEIFILLKSQTESKTMHGYPAGVYDAKEAGVEAFFVTLNKSDNEFSPTTQYKDYVISENMFHWESQNTEAHTNRGDRYVRQHENGKRFLLFVREDKKDAFGNTAPFYCFGFVDYVSSTGDFPMSITWETQQPILPQFLKAV